DNTTATIHSCPAELFFGPPTTGHRGLAAPIWSFLIHHPTLKKTFLFDLGIRKDWRNLAPDLLHLRDYSVPSSFDHISDPSTFLTTVPLIVGPGFTTKLLPGYPADPASVIRDSDYAGRRITEPEFGKESCKLGNFLAFDFLGDRSLFLLDAPGHTVGYICAFARVTPTSFVLLAGDTIHHPGELRPSPYLPLPDVISPSHFVHQVQLRMKHCARNRLGSAVFFQTEKGRASTRRAPAMVHAGITTLTCCEQQSKSCKSWIATIEPLSVPATMRVLVTLSTSFRQKRLANLLNKAGKEKPLGGFLEISVKRSRWSVRGLNKYPNDAWA
ncbi:uncharacterized protein PODANS_4_4250, partial [Podospora anserina S mat+]